MAKKAIKISQEHLRMFSNKDNSSFLVPVVGTSGMPIFNPAVYYAVNDFDVNDIIEIQNDNAKSTLKLVITDVEFRPIKDIKLDNAAAVPILVWTPGGNYGINPWTWHYKYVLIVENKKEEPTIKQDENSWLLCDITPASVDRITIVARCPHCGCYDCLPDRYAVTHYSCDDKYPPVIIQVGPTDTNTVKRLNNAAFDTAKDRIKTYGYHYCPNCGKKLN